METTPFEKLKTEIGSKRAFEYKDSRVFIRREDVNGKPVGKNYKGDCRERVVLMCKRRPLVSLSDSNAYTFHKSIETYEEHEYAGKGWRHPQLLEIQYINLFLVRFKISEKSGRLIDLFRIIKGSLVVEEGLSISCYEGLD